MKRIISIIAIIVIMVTLAGCKERALTEVPDKVDRPAAAKVEFTCHGMKTLYLSCKVRYEQFKNAKSEDLREIAEQAKMRANATASAYNNYILKNSYVWGDNVPSDIRAELPYIE